MTGPGARSVGAGWLKRRLLSHQAFVKYLSISAFVTVLDVGVTRLCEVFAQVVVANTIGVVTGFLVQYMLASRHVYNLRNTATFIKFLLTFGLGLALANGIVYVSRTYLFDGSSQYHAFLISKGLSMVLPFFALYFIRKHWIGQPVVK